MLHSGIVRNKDCKIMNEERYCPTCAARRILTLAVCLSFVFTCISRADTTSPNNAAPGLQSAIVLIVRHAEKPAQGVGLSDAGEKRAMAYATYFKDFKIGTSSLTPDYLVATADSDNSHRPKLTLEPLAKALDLKISDKFKSKDFALLAGQLKSKPHGKRILIAWHHGEIPDLIQALGGDPSGLLPNGKWPNEEFSWVIELRYDSNGNLAESARICEKLMPGDSCP
jgi:hypothetical protein